MISTHQDKLSFRSFKEKQYGVSILALFVTYGYYVTSVMRSADLINSQHVDTLLPEQKMKPFTLSDTKKPFLLTHLQVLMS